MDTTDSPTERAPGTETRRCRCCIALILTLLILGPLAVYPPVRNYLRVRHAAELTQQFQAPGADVPGLLKELSGMDRVMQTMVLDAAKDKVIGYFKSSAAAAVDESAGHCDYDGALHTLYSASLYYPDSAELATVSDDIRARKVQAAGKADTACQAKH